MRILYATDGSEGAVAAARLLNSIPFDTDTTVTILTVLPKARELDSDAKHAAQVVLTAAASEMEHSTAALERQVRWGHAAEEILRAAEEHPSDLIVLGSPRHSALVRFLLGSVVERVVRQAPCPVLLVRGAAHGLQRVVIGTDGSEGASQMTDWVRRFPLPTGCEVRVVTVLPNLHELAREQALITPPLTEQAIPLYQWQREQAAARLAEVATGFAASGAPAVTEIRSGDPGTCLVEVADDEGADLIAVGAHNGGAWDNLLLGSVSRYVLFHAHCSVLVVRGQECVEAGNGEGGSALRSGGSSCRQ